MLITSVNNVNFIDLKAYITLSYDNQCSGIVYILLIVFLTYNTLGTGEYFHESNPQSYCLSHLHHIGYWWMCPRVKPTELLSASPGGGYGEPFWW